MTGTPFTSVRPSEKLLEGKAATVSASRRLTFCAGHRIWRHESKCKNLHGHNYELIVHAAADSGLDQLGRVIDFSVLKQQVGTWLEANWDHGTILFEEDIELITALKSVGEQKLYLLPTNPTAENMALYLLHDVLPELMKGTGVTINRLTLWETENCSVEVSL
jgi:6-pyruvoyltetrahydropterin/6-carboxytetrahydropterin synthase